MGKRGVKATPAIDRLMARIVLSDVPFNGSVCWVWPGANGPGGYGHIHSEGRVAITHRVAYEHFIGPIPDGLVLDHLCRVTSCCNPAHLEAVSHLENVRRGLGGDWQRRRTHCPRGHEYAGANVRSYTSRDGYRQRVCRTCKNEASRAKRRNLAARNLLTKTLDGVDTVLPDGVV